MYTRGEGAEEEGGVRASNRKPTTAGENASRYYSRTSKALSFHSWELYFPLPTSCRLPPPPCQSLSSSKRRFSALRISHDPGNISPRVSRNAPRSFPEKKPRL